jgi:hypothetical protein
MDKVKKTEKEFIDDIDRLLAGKEVDVSDKMDADYRLNMNFAGKIIDCRKDPSSSFKEGLKRRLLIKLSEQETVEIHEQKPASSWEWLRNLIPQQPTWRLATVQIAVAVFTLAAIWGIETLSRPEPVVTWPPGGYSILELLFFTLGLVNSLFLIFIFLIKKHRPVILQKAGQVYLLLAIPAVYGIVLALQAQQTIQYGIFLGIFLAYLLIEWLYDYILKINFRDNLKKNWRWSIPYLIFYYAMNYGFVIMPWKISMAWGLIMFSLFIIQIIANLRNHPKI